MKHNVKYLPLASLIVLVIFAVLMRHSDQFGLVWVFTLLPLFTYSYPMVFGEKIGKRVLRVLAIGVLCFVVLIGIRTISAANTLGVKIDRLHSGN